MTVIAVDNSTAMFVYFITYLSLDILSFYGVFDIMI